MAYDAAPSLPRPATRTLDEHWIAESLERSFQAAIDGDTAGLVRRRLFLTDSADNRGARTVARNDLDRAVSVLAAIRASADIDLADAAWRVVRSELDQEREARAAIHANAIQHGASEQEAAEEATYRTTTELHPATLTRLAQLAADLVTVLISELAQRDADAHAPARPFEALAALLCAVVVAGAAREAYLYGLEPPQAATPHTSPRAARAPGHRASA